MKSFRYPLYIHMYIQICLHLHHFLQIHHHFLPVCQKSWIFFQQIIVPRESYQFSLQIHLSQTAGCIRHFLSVESTKQIMSVFVLFRLNYCNSLFVDLLTLTSFSELRTMLPALYSCNWKAEHATSFLHDLPWLPVQAYIEFKITMFMALP